MPLWSRVFILLWGLYSWIRSFIDINWSTPWRNCVHLLDLYVLHGCTWVSGKLLWIICTLTTVLFWFMYWMTFKFTDTPLSMHIIVWMDAFLPSNWSTSSPLQLPSIRPDTYLTCKFMTKGFHRLQTTFLYGTAIRLRHFSSNDTYNRYLIHPVINRITYLFSHNTILKRFVRFVVVTSYTLFVCAPLQSPRLSFLRMCTSRVLVIWSSNFV
jgi:hypothetical protein